MYSPIVRRLAQWFIHLRDEEKYSIFRDNKEKILTKTQINEDCGPGCRKKAVKICH